MNFSSLFSGGGDNNGAASAAQPTPGDSGNKPQTPGADSNQAGIEDAINRLSPNELLAGLLSEDDSDDTDTGSEGENATGNKSQASNPGTDATTRAVQEAVETFANFQRNLDLPKGFNVSAFSSGDEEQMRAELLKLQRESVTNAALALTPLVQQAIEDMAGTIRREVRELVNATSQSQSTATMLSELFPSLYKDEANRAIIHRAWQRVDADRTMTLDKKRKAVQAIVNRMNLDALAMPDGQRAASASAGNRRSAQANPLDAYF